MKKHKIIISSYDEPQNPYYGGGGAVAIQKVANFLQKDYTVTIICGKYPGFVDYTIGKVRFEHVGLSFVGPRLGQLVYQVTLPIIALTKTYDVWIESFTPPFSVACLPLFTKKKVIALVHMLSGKDMKRKYLLPFDFFEKIGLKMYRNFIVLTKNDAIKIKQCTKNAKVVIIPNGVDVSKDKIVNKREHILYIGRIEVDQKGLDLLLKAYSMSGVAYPLIIAGTGTEDQISLLKKLIVEYHLENKVKIVGKVTGRQKDTLYRKAICVVIPSRFETFSMVALEAFSFGRIVITFDIEGLLWIPKTIRIAIAKFDVKKLSKSLALLTDRKTKRLVREKNGKLFAKKYDWEEIANLYRKEIAENIL